MSTFVNQILFLCCFCLTRQAAAQQLLFSNLNAQIPAQECYNIMQDSKGYIWFSTEAGLCRYANNRLTVFDHKNGLEEKAVYAVTEDASGKIWIATCTNRVLFFDGTRFREPAFSAALKKLCAGKRHSSIPFSLVIDAEQLYLSDQQFTAIINIRTGKIGKVAGRLDKEDFLFEKIGNNRLIPFSSGVKGDRDYRIRIHHLREDFMVYLPTGSKGSTVSWRTNTCIAGELDFFSVGNILVRFQKGGKVSNYSFPSRITSLYIDAKNGLWVGTLKRGVFYYPDLRSMQLGHHSMDGYSVSGILLDREQGVWCSTLEKGIFYSRNAAITGYHNIVGLDKKSTLLKWEEGRIFASSSGNRLFEIERNRVRKHELPFNAALDPTDISEVFDFSDIIRRGDEWLICGRAGLPVLDKQFKFNNKHIWGQSGFYSFGYAFAHSMNGRLYHVKHEDLAEIKGRQSHQITDMKFIVFCLLPLDANHVLVGGKKGLFEVDFRTKKATRLKGVNGKVIKLLRDRYSNIWILTRDKGIFRLKRNKVTDLTTVLGLSELPLFFDMTEGKNGEIWVGAANGLYRLRLQENGWKTDHYTKLNGLPSNEVYKVATDGQSLYFSTFEGLFRFPLKTSLSNTVGPPVYLYKMTVNERDIDPKTRRLDLQYDQNKLRFSFDVLTFKDEGVTTLSYELRHNENPGVFRQIKGGELFLDNLSPGLYRLKVYGVNNDDVRNQHPLFFSIEVAPPFWRTWFFQLAAGLIVLLLIWLVIRLSVRSIHRKEEAKTLANKLMAEYQMSALQAQMNPHFIFNAINTIQSCILRKDEKQAYDYLAKFSKLIRLVLNHSLEKTLLLQQDLEVLDLYIELEQTRFGHAFDYQVRIAENVDPHGIYIPGMLIQPYIENAIWHGLMNLEDSRRGSVLLLISVSGDFLQLLIEDNGVGREKAALFGKKHNHKSIGMTLTEKRLTTLHQMRGYENARVSIIDLYDRDGIACGTRVELDIPLNLEI